MPLLHHIRQELRDVLALQCREPFMTKQAKGEDKEKQKQMHFEAFHCSESHISVLDLLSKGNGPCFAAFEKVPIEVNQAGNEAQALDRHVLELKECLHHTQILTNEQSNPEHL